MNLSGVEGSFFGGSAHAIFKRQALRVLSQIPPRLVDEVPLQSADRAAAPAGARHLPPSLSRERGRQLARGAVERPYPPVRVGAAKACDLRSGAQVEGPFVPQGATRISRHPQALLGLPVLGQGVFFNMA